MYAPILCVDMGTKIVLCCSHRHEIYYVKAAYFYYVARAQCPRAQKEKNILTNNN